MKALPTSADSSCLLTLWQAGGEGCGDPPGALRALSLFIYFPWLPSQGPPGMRGSPGPPGPIVSIRGLLGCLRGSQRRRKTQTPFCCLVPGSWAGQKGERLLPFPHHSICGDCGLPPPNPPELARSAPLCLWSCLEEASGHICVSHSPHPHPGCVLHDGSRSGLPGKRVVTCRQGPEAKMEPPSMAL